MQESSKFRVHVHIHAADAPVAASKQPEQTKSTWTTFFFSPFFFLLFLHYIYFFIGIRRSRKCFAVEKLVAEMVDICGSGGNFEKGRVCRFSTVDQRRIGGKE